MVGKWKSCHQEWEIEQFGVTMAKPLWSHAQRVGRKKGKKLKLLRSQKATGAYHQLMSHSKNVAITRQIN
jgi:hypothetical protein